MRLTLRSIMLGLGCFVSGAGSAQSILADFVYPIRPQAGVYYDPEQSGTGLTVDSVALTGGGEFVFSTYYHYGVDGTPEWMNFGAPLTQQPMATYTATGIPAVIRSQWNYAHGGQCFDCAYVAPTVTTPAYGERTINVVGARHLVMPQSGNAALRNMRLAKALKPGNVMSQSLLDSGSVWAVNRRGVGTNGSVTVLKAGWIAFKKRTGAGAGSRAVFTGYEASSVATPAFLDVAEKNTVDQYEVVCVRGLSQADGVGSCSASRLLDSTIDGFDTQSVTFMVDPSNDRIRMYERCVTPATGACPPLSPSPIMIAGDVIDAGLSPDGQQKLVVRQFWAGLGGWNAEYELTRVSSDLIAFLYPNGLSF